MNPDELRSSIIKLNICYQAICQMQKQLKYLDNDSRIMLEQAKRDLLNCIEKCRMKMP